MDQEIFDLVGFSWLNGCLHELVSDVETFDCSASITTIEGRLDTKIGILEAFESESSTWYRNSVIEAFSFMYWDEYEEPLYRDTSLGDFKERAKRLIFKLRQEIFNSKEDPGKMFSSWYERYNSKLLDEYEGMGWV